MKLSGALDALRGSDARAADGSWFTRWPLALIVFVAALVLYGITLRPGVLPADSGEFQRVVPTAGVAHPPGYPLYTILGWLFSRLPLGPSPAWRVNAFSAITAAGTLALVYAAARRLSTSAFGGVAAAVALGSATTFWATATKASIRPLTAFFAALALYALAAYRAEVASASHDSSPTGILGSAGDSRPAADRDPNSRDGGAADVSTWPLVLLSLSLSLGLTHHPSLAFPGIVFVVYALLLDPSILRQPGRWVKPLLAFLPGLLVLGYLPLRGGPGLSTPSGFLDHVLARGFRGDMFALSLLDRLVLLPTLLRFQFNPLVLLGMVLGAGLLLLRDWRLAFLLVGSFAVHMAVTLTYDAPQTVEYAVPAYVSAALLVAVPFGGSGDQSPWLKEIGARWPRLRVVTGLVLLFALALVLIGVVAGPIARIPSYWQLSQSRDTREYVDRLLDDAPRDAVILANWHWFTPLRYAQAIERARPDLSVEYVAPRGEPLEETWVRAIEERIADRPVIVARVFERAYGELPYRFEPLGEAFLVRAEPRSALPSDMIEIDVTLGSWINLLGYRVSTEQGRPARPFVVEVAWSPVTPNQASVGLFVQLLGPDGRLWSAAEDPTHAPGSLEPGEVIIDRVLVHPYLHTLPGDYALVAGAYTTEGRLSTSEGADNVRLRTVRLQPAETRPVTKHPRFVHFAGGPTLLGVDFEPREDGSVRTYLHWMGPGEATRVSLTGKEDALTTHVLVPKLDAGQYATVAADRPGAASRLFALGREGGRRWNLLLRGAVRLPRISPGERYVPLGDAAVLTRAQGPTGELLPGSEVDVRLRFHSQRPLLRDVIVSTSLTGLQSDGTWAWRASHDTVPALGAVPTLKWIRGSTVLDPHRLEIPADATSVPVMGSLLLYDHFTQRSIPNLDAHLDRAVPLGTWRTAR